MVFSKSPATFTDTARKPTTAVVAAASAAAIAPVATWNDFDIFEFALRAVVSALCTPSLKFEASASRA